MSKTSKAASLTKLMPSSPASLLQYYLVQYLNHLSLIFPICSHIYLCIEAFPDSSWKNY